MNYTDPPPDELYAPPPPWEGHTTHPCQIKLVDGIIIANHKKKEVPDSATKHMQENKTTQPPPIHPTRKDTNSQVTQGLRIAYVQMEKLR